ncbi:hypothetical protein AMTR_s00085p00138220 [Amborella trichopoda]|uniref:Uncharacterized protein n=1 Tax=Amborella trichopoda TaxID=13333 RepID=W1P575_AMBTC|nr:hypothetical protein AMTR_s00085p00138220 [Amborella trichopoda]
MKFFESILKILAIDKFSELHFILTKSYFIPTNPLANGVKSPRYSPSTSFQNSTSFLPSLTSFLPILLLMESSRLLIVSYSPQSRSTTFRKPSNFTIKFSTLAVKSSTLGSQGKSS